MSILKLRKVRQAKGENHTSDVASHFDVTTVSILEIFQIFPNICLY